MAKMGIPCAIRLFLRGWYWPDEAPIWGDILVLQTQILEIGRLRHRGTRTNQSSLDMLRTDTVGELKVVI